MFRYYNQKLTTVTGNELLLKCTVGHCVNIKCVSLVYYQNVKLKMLILF